MGEEGKYCTFLIDKFRDFLIKLYYRRSGGQDQIYYEN